MATKSDNLILIILYSIIFFIIGIYVGYSNADIITPNYNYKEQNDSLKTCITKRDSIINYLEEQKNHAIKKVYILSDSASVELFEMLVRGE